MATTPTTRVTALSRRFRTDIDTGTSPTVSYNQLFGIEEAKLIEERTTEDDEAYEDGGAGREAVTGYKWRIELKLDYSKNLAGTALDTVHAFLRTKFKATRSSSAQASEFGVRWYDRDGLDSGDSHEGRAYVKSWSDAGGKGRQTVDIVLQGQGALADITNPNADLTPVVTSVSPTSGSTAGGELVNIYGYHFTGASAVAFGTDAADDYTIVSDTQIVAITPAVTAGTVQTKVTNGTGTSANTAADDFTFAA